MLHCHTMRITSRKWEGPKYVSRSKAMRCSVAQVLSAHEFGNSWGNSEFISWDSFLTQLSLSIKIVDNVIKGVTIAKRNNVSPGTRHCSYGSYSDYYDLTCKISKQLWSSKKMLWFLRYMLKDGTTGIYAVLHVNCHMYWLGEGCNASYG
jgi:hypothetical protein